MHVQQATTGQRPGDKDRRVREMFASIADRYDLLNSVLSFRRHKAWRRAAVRMAGLHPGGRALDVCTGTADFAIDLYRAVGPSGHVLGSDFCAPMLRLGRRKADAASGGRIALTLGDAMRLPCASGVFDCVTVGFGIRNVSDIAQAFREMARVARPGGRVVCLEFNRPQNPFWRAVCDLYELRVLPLVGGLLSRRDAYTYLPESIQAFPGRRELAALMEQAGLRDIQVRDLNFGSVCIHVGTKP